MDQQNQSMFDRRTLLAFALMFAVWVGWMAIFPPEQPQSEEETPTEELTSVESTDTPSLEVPEPASAGLSQAAGPAGSDSTAAVVGSSGWLDEAPTENGEVIEVSTPLFEARFDRVGGDLLSWKLREFDLVDGSPVELVNSRTADLGTQKAHGLRVILEGRALDLRRVQFDVDRSSLALNEGDAPQNIVLSAERPAGGRIELVYTFDPSRYGYEVTARLWADDGQPVPLGLEIAWPGGLARTEPDSVSEAREIRAVAKVGDEIHKVKFANVVKNDPDAFPTYQGTVSWAGAQGKYFLAAVIDHDPRAGFVRLGGDNRVGVQNFDVQLAARGQAPAELRYDVYLGPVDYDILKTYNSDLGSLVDMGWKIFRPVAKLTLLALNWMYGFIPNWGWTIIIFSALTKMLFWPLTKSSTESMRRMQELQPQLQAMREKYKDDQQKQSQEMMRLYRENKVNPVGGCLPLMIQSPFFFALFAILRKNVHLRQSEFMLWIKDLSAPDVLFQLPFSLPILGNHFSVLPILMALGMWAQTKISQSGTSAPAGDQNAMAAQMKMMTTLMPLMMFVVFYNSPSGLVLYWFVNTVLTALQTWRVNATKPQPAQA